jgi:hypothetical protein
MSVLRRSYRFIRRDTLRPRAGHRMEWCHMVLIVLSEQELRGDEH